eukprot:Cvel_30441.t1-p1 / transcript=Cvel_30441.t1 / gene=Cvel_30441 / organism=Chromera_velia_CCMP2878 / gene_product=hypothetical protein / transcript_product=hypothetical protein / location=Cvel_scaffold4340:1836-10204(+) / protein_length=1398 / sequence_SO=supercontig / SO=protein_coding / is_pseudo=false
MSLVPFALHSVDGQLGNSHTNNIGDSDGELGDSVMFSPWDWQTTPSSFSIYELVGMEDATCARVWSYTRNQKEVLCNGLDFEADLFDNPILFDEDPEVLYGGAMSTHMCAVTGVDKLQCVGSNVYGERGGNHGSKSGFSPLYIFSTISEGCGGCDWTRQLCSPSLFICYQKCPTEWLDNHNVDPSSCDLCGSGDNTCRGFPSTCTNSLTYFTCGCASGYSVNATNPDGTVECVDANECALGTHTCSSGCVNTHGSFTCDATTSTTTQSAVESAYGEVGAKLGASSSSVIEHAEGVAEALSSASSVLSSGSDISQSDLETAASQTKSAIETVSGDPVIDAVEESLKGSDEVTKRETLNRVASVQKSAGESLVSALGVARNVAKATPSLVSDNVKTDLFTATRKMSAGLGKLSKVGGTGRQAVEAGTEVEDETEASTRESALTPAGPSLVSATQLIGEILESTLSSSETSAVLDSEELSIGVVKVSESGSEPVQISQTASGISVTLPSVSESSGLSSALSSVTCTDGAERTVTARTVAWEAGPHDFRVASRNVSGVTTSINLAVCGQEASGVSLGDQWADIIVPVDRKQQTVDPFKLKQECRFWDDTSLSWSNSGCATLFNNGSHLSCRCNHLTDFASVSVETEAVLTATNYGALTDFEKARQNASADNVLMWMALTVVGLCIAFLIRAVVLEVTQPFMTQRDREMYLVGNDAVVGRLMEGRPFWDCRRMGTVMCKCKGLRKSQRSMEGWRRRQWLRESILCGGGEGSHSAVLAQELRKAAGKAKRAGMTGGASEDFVVLPDGEFLVFGGKTGFVTTPTKQAGAQKNAGALQRMITTIMRKDQKPKTEKTGETDSSGVLQVPFDDWHKPLPIESRFVPPEEEKGSRAKWRTTEAVMRVLVRSGAFADYLATQERVKMREQLQATMKIAAWIRRRKGLKEEGEKGGEGGVEAEEEISLEVVPQQAAGSATKKKKTGGAISVAEDPWTTAPQLRLSSDSAQPSAFECDWPSEKDDTQTEQITSSEGGQTGPAGAAKLRVMGSADFFDEPADEGETPDRNKAEKQATGTSAVKEEAPVMSEKNDGKGKEGDGVMGELGDDEIFSAYRAASEEQELEEVSVKVRVSVVELPESFCADRENVEEEEECAFVPGEKEAVLEVTVTRQGNLKMQEATEEGGPQSAKAKGKPGVLQSVLPSPFLRQLLLKGNEGFVSLLRVQHSRLVQVDVTDSMESRAGSGGRTARRLRSRTRSALSVGQGLSLSSRAEFESMEAGARGQDGGDREGGMRLQREAAVLQIFCKVGKCRFVLVLRSEADSKRRANGSGCAVSALREFSEALNRKMDDLKVKRAVTLKPQWNRRQSFSKSNANSVGFALWSTPMSLWKSFVRDHPFVYVVMCEDEGLTR